MKETIETKRLLLRKFRIEDADEMFSNWANDSEVTKYMTWEPHLNVEVTKNILSLWINEYENPKTYRYAITIKETGELIGSIDVVDFVNGCPEIGYCLSRKHWNKGLMTEACKAFISYLLNEGFSKIVIEAEVNNIGSNRVIEKCGFKYTHQEERLCSEAKPYPVVVNWYQLTK